MLVLSSTEKVGNKDSDESCMTAAKKLLLQYKLQ